MDSNRDITISNGDIIFKIKINANFLKGGMYTYDVKYIGDFFATSKESLYNYIINNRSEFISFIKSKRNPNKKLYIRKKDNYDFTKKYFDLDSFRTDKLYHPRTFDKNKIFFTDSGLTTIQEWINKNLEYII